MKLGQLESFPGKLGTWNKVILLWVLGIYRCAVQSYWQSCFVPRGPEKQRNWWKRNRGERWISWQSEFLSHAILEFSFIQFLCVASMRPVSICNEFLLWLKLVLYGFLWLGTKILTNSSVSWDRGWQFLKADMTSFMKQYYQIMPSIRGAFLAMVFHLSLYSHSG